MRGTDGFTIKTAEGAYHARYCRLPAMLKVSLKEEMQFKFLLALKNLIPS